MIESDAFHLGNGLTGKALSIETANPKNFYEAVSSPSSMTTLPMLGRLFFPPGDGPFPVVAIVPGSLGLQEPHIEKAEELTNLGIAACPIDPFHARSVTSTIANQVQYSFAASAWDVLATVRHLSELEQIDSVRIGAQGHSRGGSAVLTAACEHFSAAINAPKLCGVYAAYPWSGQQFLNPNIGRTRVRAVIGDQDDWCLPQQVQGHIQAMRLTGGDATVKIFGGAHHSFDRTTPVERYDDALVSPSAPTVYIAEDGALIHPLHDQPDPELVDLDLFMYSAQAGYGRQGAHIGGGDEQASSFRTDMLAFWQSTMSV